jgi:hypothetical protein
MKRSALIILFILPVLILTVPGCGGGGGNGGDDDCLACHEVLLLTGAHARHAGADAVEYGLTGSFATDVDYQYGCGECHPIDLIQHENGTLDVDLSPVGAPNDSLKSRNAASASYDGISCSGVYCHSSVQVSSGPVGLPLTDGAGDPILDIYGNLRYDPYTSTETLVFQVTPAWDGGQITTCTACHDLPITTSYPAVEGGVGNSHQWIGDNGYGNLHAWNRGFDPLPCRTCHYGEITQANTWSRDSNDITTYDPVPLASLVVHADGERDVAFDTVNDVTYETSSGPVVHELDGAAYIQGEKACTNVGCHIQQTYVRWGTPYRWWNAIECDLCHRNFLPSP